MSVLAKPDWRFWRRESLGGNQTTSDVYPHALLDAAVEVVLTVQPVLDAVPDAAATGRWCERLLDMYRRWASRRHMQWEEIPATSSSPTLAVVSGFGVARILAGEIGLHVLEYGSSNEESARAVARVRMTPTPASVPHEQADKRTVLASELNKVPAPASVVRRYRLESSPLIRESPMAAAGAGRRSSWKDTSTCSVTCCRRGIEVACQRSAGDSDAILR